jgi:hypothetical protein
LYSFVRLFFKASQSFLRNNFWQSQRQTHFVAFSFVWLEKLSFLNIKIFKLFWEDQSFGWQTDRWNKKLEPNRTRILILTFDCGKNITWQLGQNQIKWYFERWFYFFLLQFLDEEYEYCYFNLCLCVLLTVVINELI